MSKQSSESENNQQWAVIELMGHGVTAGAIVTSELGGLLRVDVPVDDGYRTEYYGSSAIYSVKITSEEVARAYAQPRLGVSAYDEPIVPREQYEEALRQARNLNSQMQRRIDALESRLVAVDEMPQIEGS